MLDLFSAGGYVLISQTRRWSRLLLGVLLALPLVPALGNPAEATINCLSSNANWFAGHLTTGSDGGTYEGTQASIDNNDGPICDTGAHDATVWWWDWVMIANNIN